MSEKIPLSTSVIRFRDDLNSLLDAEEAMGHYRSLAIYIKKKTNIGKEIKDILDEIIKLEDRELSYKLLWIYLVTILEVYLKDRVIEELTKDSKKVEKFLREYRAETKIVPDDIIAGPEAYARSLLDGILYHKIPKVDALYNIVFGFNIIQFADFESVATVINVRHLLVHHGGTYEGTSFEIGQIEFLNAAQVISDFVEGIDYYCRFRRRRKKFPNVLTRKDRKWRKIDKWQDYYLASIEDAMERVCARFTSPKRENEEAQEKKG